MPEDIITLPEQEDVQTEEKIFSKQGNPFKSAAVARHMLELKGLDPAKFIVQSYEDGFIIVRKAQTIKKEKYWHVTFSQKGNPMDQDDVTLTVNGEPLIAQRGVRTIIPERYRECCEHATYDQFHQLPNQPKKIVGKIMTFPYTLHGEATEEEYLTLLAAGNKKTRETAEARNNMIEG
jgi:hypothetical protein